MTKVDEKGKEKKKILSYFKDRLIGWIWEEAGWCVHEEQKKFLPFNLPRVLMRDKH